MRIKLLTRLQSIDALMRSSVWLWMGLAVGVVVVLALTIWLLPEQLVKGALRPPIDGGQNGIDQLQPAARAAAVTAARQGVLLAAGGIIAMVTLAISFSRHQLERAQQALERNKQELDRDTNRTGRYTEAIGQLGSESLAIRLGGIYALERLSEDSSRDFRTIMDVLCAFVREHSPIKTRERVPAGGQLPTDVAAALAVFARRPPKPDDLAIFDLSRTCLAGTKLDGANLIRVTLEGSDLSGVSLNGANLTKADLSDANLTRASFAMANLSHAGLHNAMLSDASLFGANLEEANLNAAQLGRAQLTDAIFTNVHLYSTTVADDDGAVIPASYAYLNAAKVKNLGTVIGLGVPFRV